MSLDPLSSAVSSLDQISNLDDRSAAISTVDDSGKIIEKKGLSKAFSLLKLKFGSNFAETAKSTLATKVLSTKLPDVRQDAKEVLSFAMEQLGQGLSVKSVADNMHHSTQERVTKDVFADEIASITEQIPSTVEFGDLLKLEEKLNQIDKSVESNKTSLIAAGASGESFSSAMKPELDSAREQIKSAKMRLLGEEIKALKSSFNNNIEGNNTEGLYQDVNKALDFIVKHEKDLGFSQKTKLLSFVITSSEYLNLEQLQSIKEKLSSLNDEQATRALERVSEKISDRIVEKIKDAESIEDLNQIVQVMNDAPIKSMASEKVKTLYQDFKSDNLREGRVNTLERLTGVIQSFTSFNACLSELKRSGVAVDDQQGEIAAILPGLHAKEEELLLEEKVPSILAQASSLTVDSPSEDIGRVIDEGAALMEKLKEGTAAYDDLESSLNRMGTIQHVKDGLIKMRKGGDWRSHLSSVQSALQQPFDTPICGAESKAEIQKFETLIDYDRKLNALVAEANKGISIDNVRELAKVKGLIESIKSLDLADAHKAPILERAEELLEKVKAFALDSKDSSRFSFLAMIRKLLGI